MIYSELFLATMIVIFIVDLSGIVDTIKDVLSQILHRKVIRLRPLDCSLCSTFWTGLIIAIVEGEFTFPVVTFICMMSYLTNVFRSVLVLLQDLVMKFIVKVTEDIEDL